MDDTDYDQQRAETYKRNSQWAKKDWKITTFKSDKDEDEFRSWVDKHKVPFKIDDAQPDYDMRGFYQALKSGDQRAVSSIDPSDGQLHFPDYWKTPYHPSFSNESQWATKDAPKWIGNEMAGYRLMDKTGKVVHEDLYPRDE